MSRFLDELTLKSRISGSLFDEITNGGQIAEVADGNS